MRQERLRARRVPADTTGALVERGYHYADAFELRLPTPDGRSAEECARSALDHAPRLVRFGMRAAQRYLLGFRLGPVSDPDHIQGWRIVRRDPDIVQLEALSPLGRAVVIAQRPDPTTAVMSTYNFYATPRLGRVLWALVGPMHRRIAAYLLERSVVGAPRVLVDAPRPR